MWLRVWVWVWIEALSALFGLGFNAGVGFRFWTSVLELEFGEGQVGIDGRLQVIY